MSIHSNTRGYYIYNNDFLNNFLDCVATNSSECFDDKMVVNEEDVINIMGGMEHAGGIRLNDHKRKLKNRY